MKGETAEQVAERMRAIAASMSDKGDAAEIARYADSLLGRRHGVLNEGLSASGSWPNVSAKAPTEDL